MRKTYIIKIILLQAFILLCFVSHGQKGGKIILGERSLEVKQIEMMSVSYECLLPLDGSAYDLKDELGGEVDIITFVDYPINMYVNQNIDQEKRASDINSYIALNHTNYILYVALFNPDSKLWFIKLFSNLDSHLLTTQCQSNYNNILEVANSKIQAETNDNNYSSYIFCAINNSLVFLKEKLESNCELNSTEEDIWYLNNGYEVFDLNINIIADNVETLNGKPTINNRNDCPLIIDSSRVSVKYVNGLKTSLFEHLFGETDYELFDAVFVLTSGFTSVPSMVWAQTQANQSSCPLKFHVWIPNDTYGTPINKIYLKSWKDGLSTMEEEYNLEALKYKFDSNNYIFQDSPRWNFDFKDYKNEIIALFPAQKNQLEIGFMTGFADAFLDDLEFLFSVINITRKDAKLNYLNERYRNNIFYAIITRETLESVNATYRIESYLVEHFNPDISFIQSFFLNPSQVWTAFKEAIQEYLGEVYNDLIFQSGSFEAGHAAGYNFTILITGGVAILKTGKGILALSKGVKNCFIEGVKQLKKINKAKILEGFEESGVTTTLEKWIDEITESTIVHIFRGEINEYNKAVGCHFQGALDEGIARIRPGTDIIIDPNGSGMFRAFIDIKVGNEWIPKTAKSTFYPPTWNMEKILTEIEFAFNNKVYVSGNTWKGLSSEGIQIQFFLETDGTNRIISAFPNF